VVNPEVALVDGVVLNRVQPVQTIRTARIYWHWSSLSRWFVNHLWNSLMKSSH